MVIHFYENGRNFIMLMDVSHQQLIKQSVKLKSEKHRSDGRMYHKKNVSTDEDAPIPTSNYEVMVVFFVLDYSAFGIYHVIFFETKLKLTETEYEPQNT